MNLGLAIRIATITWIATFFVSAWLRLPWFVFFLSCCALIIVGVLIAVRYQGGKRREGLIYVTAGSIAATVYLFLPPGSPFYGVDIQWFLAVIITLGLILVGLVLFPDRKVEKSNRR